MPNYLAGAAGAIHIVLQGKAVSACDSLAQLAAVAAHSLLGRVLRLRRSCLGSLRGIDTRDRANT